MSHLRNQDTNPRLIDSILPHFGFVAVYLLWGINTSSMKIGGHEWNPLVFNGLRYLFIIPFLWGYVFCYNKFTGAGWTSGMRMSRKDLLLIIGIGVLSAYGLEVMLTFGLQYSNSANASVLGRGFMPIITAVIALVLKEIRPTWGLLAGIPAAFVGALIMVACGGGGFHLGGETLFGDLLLLLRSFIGVVYLIGMNKLVQKYPLHLLLALELTAGALSLLPVVIWQVNGEMLWHMAPVGWISLGYTALFATLLGGFLHNWSLGRLGPFRSSMYGYLLPVTAAVSGIVLLDEHITLQQFAGAAIVLGAMYIVQRERMNKKSAPAPKQIHRSAARQLEQ